MRICFLTKPTGFSGYFPVFQSVKPHAMVVFNRINPVSEWVANQKKKGKSIGFVPTMGALHKGHIALVEQAGRENDLVVCSIFVNPIQFNNKEDLKKYPRTIESDLKKLEEAGCDVVLNPDAEEMYPAGHPAKTYDFGQLDKVMEGRFRQGHFNGVAIVVKKLFDIIQPHRAYFGEKDFQQLQVVRSLVKQEKCSVQIIGCPTVREADGLALSSRNTRLTEPQRREASRIYKALAKAREMYPALPVDQIRKQVSEMINASPELELEYAEIVHPDTLLPVSRGDRNTPAVACVAAYAGKVRLIDNMYLNS